MDACLRAARKQAGHRGPKADIRVYEESGVDSQFPNADLPVQTCLQRRALRRQVGIGKLGDKGYQSQAHPQIISPHKKPKGGELTSEQRLENRQTCLCACLPRPTRRRQVARLPARSAQAGRQVAQQRIYVEHSIRRIKGWRILREDYRLGVGLFPMIAGAVVGLVQLDRILGPACADLPAAQGTAQAGLHRQVNDKENRIEGRDRLIFYSSDHLRHPNALKEACETRECHQRLVPIADIGSAEIGVAGVLFSTQFAGGGSAVFGCLTSSFAYFFKAF